MRYFKFAAWALLVAAMLWLVAMVNLFVASRLFA
jgi:hypothetical protein